MTQINYLFWTKQNYQYLKHDTVAHLALKTYSGALKNELYFCGNSNVFNCVKVACGAAVIKVGCDVMIKSLLLLIFLIMIFSFDPNRRSKSDSTSNCASTMILRLKNNRDPQHDVTTAAENIPNILLVIENHVFT